MNIHKFIRLTQIMTKMTIAGIGVEFTLLSLIYGLSILVVNYIYFPDLAFSLGNGIFNILVGLLLITIGFIIIRKALIIVQYYKEEKLCTEGIYARIRNPMYFAWIILIVPGIIIITGLVLGSTIPIFMYIIFRIFIHREEDNLGHLFREDYLKYKNSTNQFFPSFK